MDVKEHGMKNETVNFPATNVGVDSPNNTPHDTDETNPNFRCLYERTLVSAVSSFLAYKRPIYARAHLTAGGGKGPSISAPY